MRLRMIPLIGALFFSLPVLAGCGRNGEIRVVNDPFTGPQRGFALYLDMGHYTAIGVSEVKGEYTLEALVVQRGVADLIGQAGDLGEFIVGGEKLEFHSATESMPVANATRYQAFTQWKVLFKLTRDEAAQFAKGPLTAFKVAVGKQHFQVGLEPADAAKFQQNLAIMTRPSP